MEHINCNLCGSDRYSFYCKAGTFDVVKCNQCSLIYCNPRPTNEELQEFYSQDYFDEGQYILDQKRQKMYEIEIEEIKKRIGTKGKFLDVGCAVGKFLNTLPDTFEKFGVEFSEDASRVGREQFGLKIMTGQIKDLDLPQNNFDVVQMRGVLEHSQDPYADLKAIRRVLKKNGIFRISQLPNIGSICGRLFKSRFNQIKPGEHLYHFTPKTIQMMLDKAGFDIVWRMYPYLNTPYAALFSDIFRVSTFFAGQKESPAFFGNMMIIYAQRKDRFEQDTKMNEQFQKTRA